MIPIDLIQNTADFYLKSIDTKKSISIYLIVITIIPIVFMSLPFINLDITTQSRGIIRSKGSVSSIRFRSSSYVERINIIENKSIKIGDTLLILELDKLKNEIALSQNKLNKIKAFILDLEEITQTQLSYKIYTQLYQKELHEYRKKLQGLKTRQTYFKQRFNTLMTLYEQGVITNTERLKAEYEYNTTSSEITNLKNSQLSEWQNLLSSYVKDRTNLESQLKQLNSELKERIVIAPISGTIINYTGVKEGGFINSGEVIAEISPNNNLIVECFVSPKDIGYLKEKMLVNFQIDAYNYNQWGLAKGMVTEIFTDVTIINELPIFRVRCKLITENVQLKNGFIGQLKKGMTLTGRFKVTERTLWQLLYDKMDDWLNPNQL